VRDFRKLPRKKFNREAADKTWSTYTKNLINTINETEKEGHEKGYSSYEIERLFQSRLEERKNQKKDIENHDSEEGPN